MRLLADECCHSDLVRLLREAGLDVASVAELNPSIQDIDVLAMAHDMGRILLTDDKDFGEIAVLRLQPALGVILLRTQSVNPAFEARRVLQLQDAHGPDLDGLFCVVEEGRFRVRVLGRPK